MPYNKTPFKMMGKSPLMKALVGGQGNLPDHLKDAIKASPAKKHSPAKQEREMSKAELRAKAARDKRSESQTNKDAAKMENEAARLDLKANKNDRAKARKEKRLATKEETGKTGVGEVISNVKESIKENVKILPRAKKAGDSPTKQAKSKKQMRYEKTAQKAENAVADGKMKKNARLVKKSNKMNKKNNLGNNKIARG